MFLLLLYELLLYKCQHFVHKLFSEYAQQVCRRELYFIITDCRPPSISEGPARSSEMEGSVTDACRLDANRNRECAPFISTQLSAEGQKQLLFHALSLLAERNIGIRTVVMDGHGTNVGMFGLLGGSFQETDSTGMKTSFCDPATGREVYVMFDACHMLKLIRNMLHSYGNIQSNPILACTNLYKPHMTNMMRIITA